MGNVCGGCSSFRASPVQRRIVLLLVGLDNSGKTTAVRGLAGERAVQAVPTIGFSSVKMKHKGFDVSIYDLGGGPQIRAIWSCYFSDVHGVIFVVDASDSSRLEEAKLLLYRLLSHDKLAGKPVLVLANKQDVSDALDEIDVVEYLNLEQLVNQQKCITLVETCSARSPDNDEKVDSRLVRGYRWLVRRVIDNYDELNQRVELDVQEAKDVESRNRRAKGGPPGERSRETPTTAAAPAAENGLTCQLVPQPLERTTAHQKLERTRRKKHNVVFPKNVKAPTESSQSPVVVARALTSLPTRSVVDPLTPPPTRPFTCEPFCRSEVRPWGLDEELSLVDRRSQQPAEDQTMVEYLKRASPYIDCRE